METLANDLDLFSTLDMLIKFGEDDLRCMRGCKIESANFCTLEKHYQGLSDAFKLQVNDVFDDDLLGHVDDIANKKGYTLFSKDYLETLKRKYQELRLDKPRIFIDATDVLYKDDHSLPCLEKLFEKNYFNERPPHKMMMHSVNELMKLHPHQVYILSYCIDATNSEACMRERIRCDLPWMDPHNIILVPYGGMNKASLVPNGISEKDVLIDDYLNNLLEWQSAGGKAVKFINDQNSIQNDWDGPCIIYDDPSLPETLSDIYESLDRNEMKNCSTMIKETEDLLKEQPTWQTAMLEDEFLK